MRRPETPAARSFSILTWNIGRSMHGSGETLRVIEESRADIVLLQETTQEWEPGLRRRLGGRYPYVAFKPYAKGGGLAVLSMFPFEEHHYVMSPAGKYPGWIVSFATPVGEVEVLVVHLHPPVNDSGRFTVTAALQRRADRLSEVVEFTSRMNSNGARIVAGDFNESSSGRSVSFLIWSGFTNALPEFDGRTPTWSLWKRACFIRGRIDHILYIEPLHCFRAGVLSGGGSDHRAVLAVLGKLNSPDER